MTSVAAEATGSPATTFEARYIGAEACAECHVPQMHDLNMGFDTAEGFQFQQMRDHNIGIYPEISSLVAERMDKPLQSE